MADKQSVEKQALLRAYGAEVVLCPTNVAPESPESYYSVAARLARDIPGAFKPDQYWNEENPRAHEATTGPEIWRQTQGRVTHLVASVGTGGTITGIARHLKAQDPAVRIIGADPEGSVLSGDVARPYLTEGVGEDFMPGTFDPAVVDRWVRVSDRDAFAMARRLTREEGILAGESCGTALVAALDEAARLMREEPATARDAVMVVLLPDGGRNYLSKLYNDEWLRANGLVGSPTAPVRVAEVLVARHGSGELPAVVLARTTELVATAIDTLQRFGISQMPVSERAGRCHRGHRRLDQRAEPPGAGVSRPLDRGADGRRGDGAAAADHRHVGGPRRGVPAALRRGARAGGRRPAAGRPASSASSTCWSSWPTAGPDPTRTAWRRAMTFGSLAAARTRGRMPRTAEADSLHPPAGAATRGRSTARSGGAPGRGLRHPPRS